MKNILYITSSILFLSTSVFGQDFGKLKQKVNETVQSDGASSSLTEGEVANGLKEALNNGIEKGVAQLSKPDGYFKDAQIKIPLPELKLSCVNWDKINKLMMR